MKLNRPVSQWCLGIASLLLFATLAHAGGEDWSHDAVAALEQAKAERKDLLMDFTGSTWCGYCIRLNKEVFAQEEFKTAAPEHFVLLEFDFLYWNAEESAPQTDEVKRQNAEWRDKFGVYAYPTVFLADSDGRPYAMTTYREGGPAKYLEHLGELRNVRELRDQALAAAAETSGTQRATYLAGALQTVGEKVARIAYRDVMREIIELDSANEAGLKAKYEPILAEAEFNRALRALENQSGWSGVGPQESLDRLEKLLATFSPTGQRLANAAGMKTHFLVALERRDLAIEYLGEVLQNESLDADSKMRLWQSKAGELERSERFDEASAAFDEAVQLAPATGDAKAEALYFKAEFHKRRRESEDACHCYDEAIAATASSEFKANLEKAKQELQVNPAVPDAAQP
jgi:tetratricopeptide (TPR) repeat protein